MNTINDFSIALMLYEGLMRSTDEGPTLALGNALTISEDELSYTFTLRPSTWSDGICVTPKDFLAAYQTALDPSFPSSLAFLLFEIKNGEKIKKGLLPIEELGVDIDENSITFHLEHKTPYFLSLLSMPIYFPIPSHRLETKELNFFESSSILSNGPFSLTNWQHQASLQFKKNPLYWDNENVYLETIECSMIDPETELLLFEKEQLDFAGSPFSQIHPDHRESLIEQNRLFVQPIDATVWIRVNTKVEPLNNLFVRQVISHSIDRSYITQHILYNCSKPANSIVPNLRKIPFYQYQEIERAKQFINDTRPLKPITLMYVHSPIFHRIAQSIKEQIEAKLNIEIQLEAVERKIFFSRVSMRDFDLSIGDWFADFPDPINFLINFKTKDARTNNTYWENPIYQDLLDKSEEASGEARTFLLEKAEEILLNEAPIIALYHPSMLYVKNPHLKGFHFSNTGLLDFKTAYFD